MNNNNIKWITRIIALNWPSCSVHGVDDTIQRTTMTNKLNQWRERRDYLVFESVAKMYDQINFWIFKMKEIKYVNSRPTAVAIVVDSSSGNSSNRCVHILQTMLSCVNQVGNQVRSRDAAKTKQSRKKRRNLFSLQLQLQLQLQLYT